MKKRRMNNIFKKDGRSFVLAMDHSAQMYSPDLKDPGHIIRECAAGGVDCFLTTYGIIKHFADDFGNAGIMMRADGGASMIRKPMNPLDLLYSAEDAVRVGADSMLCMGLPGSQANEHSLKYLAKLAADGEKYGLSLTVIIDNFDFTDVFTNAVEAKQVAEQEKLRAQTEQEKLTMEAEQKAARDKIEAESSAAIAKINAEADLEVQKINADAAEYAGQKEAAVNQAIAESLTPELVAYYEIMQWNGQLPTTIVGESDAIPVINVTE